MVSTCTCVGEDVALVPDAADIEQDVVSLLHRRRYVSDNKAIAGVALHCRDKCDRREVKKAHIIFNLGANLLHDEAATLEVGRL